LSKLSSCLREGFFGLFLVSFCELSWSQYEKLITFLRKSWNDNLHAFTPTMICFPEASYVISKLLPSSQQVKALWNFILPRTIPYYILPIAGIFAIECLIPNVIEYVYGNPLLYSLLHQPLERLEVIVTLDAFPVGGGHCFLMCITFGNFGMLCKCSYLHFITALADCSDDDRSVIEQILHNNFALIDQLLHVGSIYINAIKKAVPITFNFGGDDKILRLITGLERSASKWCCFYCFWRRDALAAEQVTTKRTTDMATEFAVRHECGHMAVPMLKNLAWTNYKMCVLHALMSMGRLLCHWIHEWCAYLETKTGNSVYWTHAQAWLTNLHINITISKKPVTGSWNCKGIFAARMFASFPVLMEYLHIPANVGVCVHNMRRIFHVLYKFDFHSPKDKAELQWYKANVFEVSLKKKKAKLIY